MRYLQETKALKLPQDLSMQRVTVRPWRRSRRIGLEDYEHAKARGAKIYCEIGGGGMSSDAYHLTAPHPEGIGVIAVMNNTLARRWHAT
jgi:hypothetical protein